MKKYIIGLVLVILVVSGLSGCVNEYLGNGDTEDEDKSDNSGNGSKTGDTNLAEIVSHNVITFYQYPTKYSVNFGDPYDYVSKELSGFVHDFPKDSRFEKYIITGTVKNIAGYMIDVKVIAKFYDANGNYLHTESDNLNDIANSYTKEFEITYSSSDKYFENVNSVKFELEVT